VLQVVVRILPEPASATAAQPLIDVAPSRKLTLPLGALPLTVAVKVTLLPTVDGVREVAIPVVVVALLVLPVGSTNKVTLCAGTVVLKLDPVKVAQIQIVPTTAGNANIVAPAGNHPPGYPNYTIYHYFTVIGYDSSDTTVLIADPAGFAPTATYWLTFDQLATLIPPKGYSA